MPNRGGINRRTGKTTPRHKARTHWGGKAPAARPRAGKPGAAKTAKA